MLCSRVRTSIFATFLLVICTGELITDALLFFWQGKAGAFRPNRSGGLTRFRPPPRAHSPPCWYITREIDRLVANSFFPVASSLTDNLVGGSRQNLPSRLPKPRGFLLKLSRAHTKRQVVAKKHPLSPRFTSPSVHYVVCTRWISSGGRAYLFCHLQVPGGSPAGVY